MSEHDEIARCAGDAPYFIRTYCLIRHPLYGAIPFALWSWQEEVLWQVVNERLIIILKARQLGITELAAAYALWRVRFTPGWLGLIVARNQADACDVLDRILFMHDNLPEWLGAAPSEVAHARAKSGNAPAGSVHVRKRNTRVFELGHITEMRIVPSRIQSLPATRGTGRGKPASWVFLDEWAHQPWQSQIIAAIQPTLATGGALLGVSTANGVGNAFHAIWRQAECGANGYRAIFLPWHLHPEHDAAWHAEQRRILEPWQVAQEHPDNAGDAFVQSGRPVFDHAYLDVHRQRIAAEPSGRALGDGLVTWAAYTLGHRYIIGADVAEGVAAGDYSAACMLDATTGHQVAALHGRWPPEDFARRLVAMAEDYATPLLAVERNNHGHACLLQLRLLRYPRLYYAVDRLTRGAAIAQRPGWVTDRQTKPMLIDSLAASLREAIYTPHDMRFIDEAAIFSYRPDGGTGAPNGMHDDHVIAHAIAVYLATQPDPVNGTLHYFDGWKE